MTNKDKLTNYILILQPNFYIILKKYKIDPEHFLSIISKFSDYNLAIELRKSSVTVSKLLKELLPDRPKTTAKIHTYILAKFRLKYCSGCNNILNIQDFNLNSSRSDGLQSECKHCHYVGTKLTQNARSATYRCCKVQRTPSWANIPEIARIYALCPEGHHVDHVIPLQGELVSGLHVHNNLQYLTGIDNLKKSNKYRV